MELTEEQKNVWWDTSKHKKYTISFLDSGIPDIDNSRIYSESLVLTDTLCDDKNIVFGSCCAAQFEIQLANISSEIKNYEMSVVVECDGVDVPLGIYIVDDVGKTSNRKYKKVTAYDRMIYLNEDFSTWYNTILPDEDSTTTLKEFRTSFFNYAGLPQEDISLINDDMIIRKTVDTDKISGVEIMQAVCELNGVFGHFNRYGVFCYVSIQNTSLYPADNLYPADDLYPSGNSDNLNFYISSEYQDYITLPINRLQIRQEEGDIGYVSQFSLTEEEANDYIITGNFITYGMSHEELTKYGNRLFDKIKGYEYKPAVTTLPGVPYWELGGVYVINSKYDNFESLVLKHTLSGGQSLQSVFEANGEYHREEDIDGLNYQFQQLKGKSNKLTRTVEETISELRDLEKSTDTKFTQTAGMIQLEANRATQAEEELSSQIQLTAEQIEFKVSNTYETKEEAKASYEELESSITLTAESIKSKVSKGDVSSEISQEAEQVTISGNRFVVDADNFALTADGTTIQKAGVIGGLKIGSVGLIGCQDATDPTDFTAQRTRIGQHGWANFGPAYGDRRVYINSDESGGLDTVGITVVTDGTGLAVTDYLGSAVAISPKGIFVSGSASKAKIINTENYGCRTTYADETMTPTFTDYGMATIGENGTIEIDIDDIFSEMTDTDIKYVVFLTPYGSGECYVAERKKYSFVISGTPYMDFAWQIKAIQKYNANKRNEIYEEKDDLDEYTEPDYAGEDYAMYKEPDYAGEDIILIEGDGQNEKSNSSNGV